MNHFLLLLQAPKKLLIKKVTTSVRACKYVWVPAYGFTLNRSTLMLPFRMVSFPLNMLKLVLVGP